MEPTYSFSEIKSVITSFDAAGMQILEHVVAEESALYAPHELKAIRKIIELRNMLLVRMELRYDHVLSFH